MVKLKLFDVGQKLEEFFFFFSNVLEGKLDKKNK